MVKMPVQPHLDEGCRLRDRALAEARGLCGLCVVPGHRGTLVQLLPRTQTLCTPASIGVTGEGQRSVYNS
jgi:hypothetical protein